MFAMSLEFLVLAGIVIVAGALLTRAADQIAEITGFGRLLIGSVLLAGVTSLPELTVDVSAVRIGMPDLATGDLLGSSLMNLLILAGLDLLHKHGGRMLSREASAHALSGTLAIALTGLVGLAIMTAPQLPSPTLLGISLWSWAIFLAYVMGVRMVYLDQRISVRAAVAEQGEVKEVSPKISMWRPISVFAVAAIALCLCGPRLADVAGRIADHSGWGKTFVGTTLVALTTSLPELVASITAIRMKAFDLVIGNVFGSNAFNMILFLPLDALHPGSIYSAVAGGHGITALAVIVATAIAVLGQLYRVEQRWRLVEPDAMLMLVVLLGSLFLVFQVS